MNELRDLLESKKVNLIIAFEKYKGKVRPVFISNPSDLSRVTLDADGTINLTTYLKRKEIRSKFPIAIVARKSERESLAKLIKENQIKDENVFVINSSAPDQNDEKIKQLDLEIDRLFALPHEERMAFWEKQFESCQRCYACRQSCPNCYCQTCKADKNRPAWIESSPHARGNFSWNFLRAFHQAGRCALCGACEAACPAKIPLMLLNRMQNRVTSESFGTGKSDKALLSTWSKDDDNSFFL